MNARDLAHFDSVVLSRAAAVVSMREVHTGARGDDVIGLRHDVDDNKGSLQTAVRMARWEHARGYRSTYYLLHTAPYWHATEFPRCLDAIAAHGHEIGLHANAIPAALLTGRDPAEILDEAIVRLQELGHPIVGVAPHGDKMCRNAAGEVVFVNDEIFAECPRPEMGAPDRIIRHGDAELRLNPLPFAAFGLEYETYRLPRGRYLSDSGGRWNVPPASVATGPGQLHILQHPDWWADAFRER